MEYFRHSNTPALLITGTNKSKDAFNDRIRKHLLDAGTLSAKGQTFTVANARGHEKEKEFVCGERIVFLKNESREVQFMDKDGRPVREGTQKIFNGSQGIIDDISEDGDIFACLVDEEGNRTEHYVRWNVGNYPFFDYSYALSTYKSQGQSVERLVMYHAPSDSPILSKNEFLVGISRNKIMSWSIPTTATRCSPGLRSGRIRIVP